MAGRRDDVLAALRAAATPLSINEIAERLAVHPNTVRFHLEALVKTGQAEYAEVDHAKPGRPPLMFRAVPGMDPGGPRHYRMLASIFADAIASAPDPVARAVAAGRAWAEQLTGAADAPSRRQAIDRLTALLTDWGFAPEKRSKPTKLGEIGLRSCPFLELARTRRDVVCAVHLGLMQGALSGWDAPITVHALTPFAEPDLCVAHLAPIDRAS
ncbi:MAG: helix-turn-helix domain-containing protein [Mycolicibacterium sp.]|nr:helix-turn-helix domain-containing protein [Mycolicibacterium sp.]